MQIASSTVDFSATHRASVRDERSERLDAWMGNQRLSRERSEVVSAASATQVSLSQSARLHLQWESTGSSINSPASVDGPAELSVEPGSNDPMMSFLKSMIEALTGHAVDVFSSADLPAIAGAGGLPAATPAAASGARSPAGGFGMAYDAHYRHEEHESLDFSAQGEVRTADGQTIRFKVDLQFERHYVEEQHVSVRAGAARKDPLVINFGGNADLLTNQSFRFDLNGDGRQERLPGLAGGTGFLVFDCNGNGKVDDGNELFGPRTDNGFAELALLDTDGNGWVDAGDANFASLGVWNPADQAITRLADAGVAALAVAHADTPFELRDANNRALGNIAESGVFVGTDGRAGALHDIDMRIHPG